MKGSKKGGSILTKEYFEQLLERIREIRLSERKFYQKITDIYATSIDYDSTAKETKRFFAAVQNKLHYAVHGQTAVEVIYNRADAEKEHMGLTTWEGSPNSKIHKYDVSVAKNYLTEKELAILSRMVTAYLDLAESMAMRNIPMTMADSVRRVLCMPSSIRSASSMITWSSMWLITKCSQRVSNICFRRELFPAGNIKCNNDTNLSSSATDKESSCVTAHEIRNTYKLRTE